MAVFENYSRHKGFWFMIYLIVGAEISHNPKLSAKFSNGYAEVIKEFYQEGGENHRANDTLKERIPMH